MTASPIGNCMIFAENNSYVCLMPNFSSLDLTEMYDLLAIYTKIYTKMLSLNLPPTEQFLHTKSVLDKLQVEIQSRTENTGTESEGFKDGQVPAIA